MLKFRNLGCAVMMLTCVTCFADDHSQPNRPVEAGNILPAAQGADVNRCAQWAGTWVGKCVDETGKETEDSNTYAVDACKSMTAVGKDDPDAFSPFGKDRKVIFGEDKIVSDEGFKSTLRVDWLTLGRSFKGKAKIVGLVHGDDPEDGPNDIEVVFSSALDGSGKLTTQINSTDKYNNRTEHHSLRCSYTKKASSTK